MLFLNVQCISNKCNELEMILSSSNFDILCFTEHWLSHDQLCMFNLMNYNLISDFSRSCKKNGGVALYASKDYAPNCKAIDVSGFCLEQHHEFACLSVPDSNLIVIGVYRSPDGNLEWFLDSLEKLVLSLENRRTKNNLVLGGDVNIDILKGEKHSEDFLNLLKSLNLYCLVWEPTRGNSCLDNVATDLPKRLLKTEVKRLAVSDHDAVSLHVQTASSAVPDGSGRRVCRPISTDKINNFIYRLDNTNWDFLYNTGAAEDTFNCFFQNFLLMFNECFPTRLLPTKRSKKNQNLPDWKDQSLVTWKKWVLLAYDLYRDNKTPDSELRYKTIKKQYKQKLLSARLERNARFIESASNRCAAAWKVIHEEGAPSKSQLISSVTAEAFNAHFIDSVQQTRDAINGSATSALDMLEKRDPAASRFNITLLSCESVIRVVQKLNNSPSKDIFEFGTCQSLNSKRG
ncbi:uncharacterized protein LOC129005818 [Macrosteles quadrilineatus]|uniref:uncharacterized protein LOC129005818 n=1 Tax=Macrosteles quadrilineatus TaxID=74068 RepID=UPI0023E28C65|nr:uncharacterized protein LOC129005818 [Macrosteles quadrilineatus]